MKKLLLCSILAFVAAATVTPGAFAQTTVSFVVLGSANPFLAGMPAGTALDGDSAPGQSPTQVTGLNFSSGGSLFFDATGGVDFGGGAPTDGPDGSFSVFHDTVYGIGGLYAPANALVGVFLGADQPDLTPAPDNLDFTSGAAGSIGTAFSTFAPELKQVFFIGDGLTGTGTGVTQTFTIPTGATRFYLGTVDGSGWFNNSGQMDVRITGPALISASAPEPGSLPLLALTALPMAVAINRKRRVAR